MTAQAEAQAEAHAEAQAKAGRLGIIAGGGPFPGRVAAAAHGERVGDVFVVALRGFAEAGVVGPLPAMPWCG